MIAGASGIIGSIKEAFAAGRHVMTGSKDTNPLIRDLSSSEEVKSMQARLKEVLNQRRGEEARDWLAAEAVSHVRQAVRIVDEKAPAELDDYKRWIMDVATAVANAAKEGGFLGFGGERVSSEEQKILGQLRAATSGF